MAKNKKWKFCIYCEGLNFKQIRKQVQSMGYELTNVTTAINDDLAHRFACYGKSGGMNHMRDLDFNELSKVPGVSIVSYQLVKDN